MTQDKMRQASLNTDLSPHTVVYRVEQFRMAVRSNEMETIIDPMPTVRSTAAGS